ncbi:MAG: hypothetical protein ACPH9K_06765 [Candidatus Poseidoniaceae archaeon]
MEGSSEVEAATDLLQSCFEEKRFTGNQRALIQTSEEDFIHAWDLIKKTKHLSQAEISFFDFLMSARRFHFAYTKSGELWDILSYQHPDVNESTMAEHGPFICIIEIEGYASGQFKIITLKNSDSKQTAQFGQLNLGNDPHYLHVLYSYPKMSETHKFQHRVLLSQKSQKKQNQIKVIVENLSILSSAIHSGISQVEETRKDALNSLCGLTMPVILEGFDELQTQNLSRPQIDLLEFIINSLGMYFRWKDSKQYLDLHNPDDNKSLLVFSFEEIHKGGSPQVYYLNEEMIAKILTDDKADPDFLSAMRVNQRILHATEEGMIAVGFCDPIRSLQHKFPFDLTFRFKIE